MQIKGIAHTAYFVNDIEESLRFYCEKLGMEKLFTLDLSGMTLVYVKVCEGQFIELFYGEGIEGKALPQRVGYAHLCLEVTDIYALAKELAEKGVTTEGEPQEGLDHNFQLWAVDPDGNRIEFMQYGKNALQFQK